MAQHKTYKGKPIDIQAMQMANQEQVALGNAKMNARGDVLGQGGKVVKTREETTREYHQARRSNVVETDEPQMIEPLPVAEDITLDDFVVDEKLGAVPVDGEQVAKPKRRRAAPKADKDGE